MPNLKKWLGQSSMAKNTFRMGLYLKKHGRNKAFTVLPTLHSTSEFDSVQSLASRQFLSPNGALNFAPALRFSLAPATAADCILNLAQNFIG
jgi:hypothetical protein